MYTACSLILCLAVFAAPALGSCAVSALPGPTFCAQTPVIQNPTTLLPGNIPNGAIATSQHCFRTVVRPQIRNEIVTVPSVDRIVRYVPGPVEAVTIHGGFSSRGNVLPTVAGVGGLVGAGYGGLVGAGYGCNGLVGAGFGCGGLVGAGCGCGCGSVVV